VRQRFCCLGTTVPEIYQKIGIAGETYYRWHNKHSSLSVDQAKRLKKFEKENTCLRKLVADLSLEKAILKEVAEGKY
jgi:putative transposase